MTNKEKSKIKFKVTLKEKVILFLMVFFLLGVAVAVFYSTYFLNQYTNMLQENVEQHMAYVARQAAEIIEPEQFIKFRDLVKDARAEAGDDEDEFLDRVAAIKEDPEYKEIIAALRDFCAENNVIYTYYMWMTSDAADWQNVLFDSDEDEETNLSLWYFEEPDAYTGAAWRGETVTTKFGVYTEGYEGIMPTYAPFYDGDEIIGMVGVDISDAEIVSLRMRTGIMTYILLIGVIALVGTGFMGILLYRRKAAEQAQANLAKSQFLSRMSHEIRTPMNAIIGFCRMAGNSSDIDRIKDYLVNISDSSDFLLQLINSILDISKIEAGKMSLHNTPVSLNALIQNVHSMLKSQAEAKKQTFTLYYDDNIPPVLMCDNTYLTQVIVNLVSNAIKFTPAGGEITLSVKLIEIKDRHANVRYTVTDNGIGIDQKNIDKLFEPFEQGDSSITRKFGGTGLGLTISKLLVEMMGGRINVESKPGSGSSFIFNTVLEIADGENRAAALKVPEKEAAHKEGILDCSGRCFLVAEDNEINQLIAGSALEDFGAVVEFADNGQTALEMYLKTPNKYDLIFMDIHMPLMDGYEAARRIRASNTARAGSIPIIAMTANVFREDIEAALKSGMNAHIGKPFDIEQLAAAIKAALK